MVFITSIGGKLGVPHLAPYSAAKFAEMGLAEALRAEVAKDGVRVLTVVPGLMRTGSHLQASFHGDPEKELTWFGASATAPLISIDADRAARRIVRAIARGDSRLVFTPTARIAARTHDLAPGLWAGVLSLAASMLPRAPERSRIDTGLGVVRTSRSRPIRFITARSATAARQHQGSTVRQPTR
jgi:short-subunit dehydrogenase